MVSEVFLSIASMPRPSTRSRDAIPRRNHTRPPSKNTSNLELQDQSTIIDDQCHIAPLANRPFNDDNSSLFFLSTGDHPRLVLVSTVLNGSNYQSWKRGITMALVAKNKITFIDGSLPRPEIGNGPRIFQLQTQLTRLQQGDQSLSSYFTKMKSLWDELKEFQPITTCTCGAMKIFLDYYNQNQVLQFLTGLNESFASVRAQILLNKPIPNLSCLFAMIIKEERQCSPGSTETIPLVAASSSVPNYPPRAKKPRPSCSNFGKPSHIRQMLLSTWVSS
uniref:Retrotransposon Copia-like N-terminal domain-containing protein n=1 Tax=Cannabis sativa TaxID=3483 RepID=A0A803P4U0_CANSA